MIIERKILESKTVSLKIPLPGPGNAGYRTVKISLPSKIRYKLHRHSLSKVSGTEGLGTYMAGVVDGYIVWDSRCICGLTSSVTWEIPDLSELTVDHAAKVTSVTTTKIQGENPKIQEFYLCIPKTKGVRQPKPFQTDALCRKILPSDCKDPGSQQKGGLAFQ